MVTFVTRCELTTATSMLLLAHRRDRFRVRRARWLQERRRGAGRLQQGQLNDGAHPARKARHEPPLPLVPVPVPVPARYLQQMGTGTGNHIEMRAPAQSRVSFRYRFRHQWCRLSGSERGARQTSNQAALSNDVRCLFRVVYSARANATCGRYAELSMMVHHHSGSSRLRLAVPCRMPRALARATTKPLITVTIYFPVLHHNVLVITITMVTCPHGTSRKARAARHQRDAGDAGDHAGVVR
jgi:hypothetical protein